MYVSILKPNLGVLSLWFKTLELKFLFLHPIVNFLLHLLRPLEKRAYLQIVDFHPISNLFYTLSVTNSFLNF
jgi:Na+/phosphate symporter